MYFVNRSEIEAILNFFDDVLAEVKKMQQPKDKLHFFAFERMTHIVIESIIDVGNRMIDGFIMRDPGSYSDIIDILVDEQVIPSKDEATYKQVINLRKMLIQSYREINHKELTRKVNDASEVLTRFSTHIREFLDNEMGVANAFSNEDEV